jgi:ribosomal protein S18 acetylase RimI-like enzyme
MAVKHDILSLGQKLFVPEEWPSLRKSIHEMLDLSRTLYIQNKLVAFVVVNQLDSIDRCAFLSYCGVDPQYQGKGFGSKLLKETLAGIFQAGFHKIRLHVDDWNVDARKLYERLGFHIIGNVQQSHVSCFLMEKSGRLRHLL